MTTRTLTATLSSERKLTTTTDSRHFSLKKNSEFKIFNHNDSLSHRRSKITPTTFATKCQKPKPGIDMNVEVLTSCDINLVEKFIGIKNMRDNFIFIDLDYYVCFVVIAIILTQNL